MPRATTDQIFAAARLKAEKRARNDEVHAMARSLYETMPGAPHVPTYQGERMWGEVDGTEHWEFCAAIARIIADRSK